MNNFFDGTSRNKARIIVAGGRGFIDYALLSAILKDVLKRFEGKDVVIVSGGCRGADSLGERYAGEHGLQVVRFPAEWAVYGKAAGPIRNRKMVEYASEASGILVAFWDGESRGTANIIRLAKQFGLQTKITIYVKCGG